MKKLKLAAILLFLATSGWLRPISGAAVPGDDEGSGESEVAEEPTTVKAEAEAEAAGELEATFKGHKLIEAVPKTPDDVEFLRTLDETVPEDVLDFWATPVKAEEPVPILVHPELLPHVVEAFEVSCNYHIKLERQAW